MLASHYEKNPLRCALDVPANLLLQWSSAPHRVHEGCEAIRRHGPQSVQSPPVLQTVEASWTPAAYASFVMLKLK